MRRKGYKPSLNKTGSLNLNNSISVGHNSPTHNSTKDENGYDKGKPMFSRKLSDNVTLNGNYSKKFNKKPLCK